MANGKTGRRGTRKPVAEQKLLTGIAQGVARAVTQPMASTPPKKPKKSGKKNGGTGRGHVACMDAFNPAHLPLPRAVAPYLVVRTTRVFEPPSNAGLSLFGPMYHRSAGNWSNAMVMSTRLNYTTSTIGDVDNWSLGAFASMASGAWSAATATPSAFSMQIMNPTNLQNASGTLFAGRVKNKFNLSDMVLSQTVEGVANNLVAFTTPRIIAAGKLSLRGVQIDAVPNNMNALSDFTPVYLATEGNTTMGTSFEPLFDGFNPLFVFNPDNIRYKAICTCEWRVRFDPSNPAHSAARMHKPATENMWADTINAMVAAGNGVVDIVERVANSGLPAAAARAAGYL